jgi:hypothetical protein
MASLDCRFCGAPLTETFADLGLTPLANAYLPPEQLEEGETFYPLHARVCGHCFLVQVPQFEAPEGIFGDYAYFSSYSSSWLDHCRRYCEMARERFALDGRSFIVEVASNDGYLLSNFHRMGLKVLGIEPAANVARVAIDKGIATDVAFFGAEEARRIRDRHGEADLLIGNNVLAHVPDLNDFVAGLEILLADTGTINIEVPHLLRLMENNQFDTIYHEHFSYFSLTTLRQVFAARSLRIFDVDQLGTHGGSLRIYAGHDKHVDDQSAAVQAVLSEENAFGLDDLETYRGFASRVRKIKRDLLSFLIGASEEGKTVAAYGAAAKGNTLLNYCGIAADLVAFVADRSPHKQGKFLPGTRIPIRGPEAIEAARPDYVLILPWNLRDEIMDQLAAVRDWNGRFVVPIPALEVIA